MAFGFDRRKAATNRRKHGVIFEEAISVFYDPLASTIADGQNSLDEERWITVKLSNLQRTLSVVYTERAEAIRIIGARVATSQGREQFEDVSG